MAGSFSEAWNSAFEAEPADDENINLGASRMRDFKVSVRQRLAIDHSIAGDVNDGKHNQVTLRQLGGVPEALDPGDGLLFVNAVTGNTELYYQDSSTRVIQVTSNGIVNAPPEIPRGSVMLFAQITAPVGWIQDVSKNDILCYVTNGSAIQGGSVGGLTWIITGVNAITDVAPHTLTSAEIPAHSHNVSAATAAGGTTGFQAGANLFLQQTSIISDGGTGGGQAHSHVAGTTVFADGTWRPPVLGVIVCQKQ